MAVLEGFMPPGLFKEGCRNGWEFEHPVPSRTLNKQRRAEVSTKPVESHPYFVALFLNEDGLFQMKSSGPMRRYERHILEEALHKFKDIMENYIELTELKRHRTVNHLPLPAVPRDRPPHSYAKKPVKRRFPASLEYVEQPPVLSSQRKEPLRQPPRGDRLIALRFDDKEAQATWFSDAFKAVQQVACRTIAKVWIKKIHPKKQSTHPYNGLYPRHTQADPSRTRPDYWPLHVIHKEPDHIDRNARTALLVHLIMNTPQRQIKHPQDTEILITARDLCTALEEKKLDFKGDRWIIITEIIQVREKLEMFENNGFDPDTVIFVPDFSELSRPSKSGTEAGAEESDEPMPEPDSASIKEEGDDETVTPPSTSAHSPLPDRSAGAQQANCLAQNSVGVFEEQQDEQGKEQDAEEFNSPANDLSTIASEHDSIGMAVDPRTFVRDQKADPSQLRLQRYLEQDSMAFRQQSTLRQEPDLMLNPWLMAGSSTEFLPAGFGLDSAQMLPTDEFQVGELGLMHGNRQQLSMHTAHGLPMSAGMTYQDFTTTAPRPLPVRTMSTPHTNMMDGVHGLGHVQQSYFNG